MLPAAADVIVRCERRGSGNVATVEAAKDAPEGLAIPFRPTCVDLPPSREGGGNRPASPSRARTPPRQRATRGRHRPAPPGPSSAQAAWPPRSTVARCLSGSCEAREHEGTARKARNPAAFTSGNKRELCSRPFPGTNGNKALQNLFPLVRAARPGSERSPPRGETKTACRWGRCNRPRESA